MEDRLLLDPMLDKAILLMYRKTLNNAPDALGCLRDKWVADLGEIDDEEWGEALQVPRVTAIGGGFRLVQLRIFHRSDYSTTLLHKIGRVTTYHCVMS